MTRLTLEVLGPIRALAEAEIPLGRPSHRRLLAILALDAGRPLSTDALIDRFWPGDPPATAKAALQTHVFALRKLLADGAIVTEGQGYRLNVDPASLDSSEFLRLGAEARAAADGRDWQSALAGAEEALSLWRGRPFDELVDDHFARPEIVRLEETRLELLEMRAEAMLGLGRPGEVLPDLEGLVIEHPLRERLWEHLMTARYGLGRHTEALRAYQEVRRHLAEIGLEPGERLRRLEGRILLHDEELTSTRHNLPVELSDFVGRRVEMTAITELVVGHRLVTLAGAAGSGKTRLATMVAQSLFGSFPGGVWLVELAAIEDPDLIPTEIASAMGLRPRGDDALSVVADAIDADATLMILDNCEHLLAGAAATAHRLLQSSAALRILATSREPLRVPGESVCEIAGLSFPDAAPALMSEALGYEAVQLFEQRARQVNPSFRIDEQTVAAVVAICRRLDGMPLAIELAAARVRSLTVGAVADRLDDQLRLLTTGSSTAPPRQRTLEATIEWSYRLLDHIERTVLGRLSVFRGGFTLDAAAEVVPGVGIASDQVIPTVSNLVDKSLVTTYRTRDGARFRLLESVRQYADFRFRDASERTVVRGQHAQWCLSVSERLWDRAIGDGTIELARDLEADSDNLLAALEWSTTEGDRSAVVTLSQALGWHWYFTGHLGTASAMLRQGLAYVDDEGDEALMRALLARCLAYAEDIDGAISEAEAAHRALPALDGSLAKAWIISTLQLSYFSSVESGPRSMLALASEAQGIADTTGDVFAEVLARQTIADAYCWNGRTAEGLAQQEIALELAAATQSVPTINHIYGLSIYNYMLDRKARRTEPLRVTEQWQALVRLDVAAWTSIATDWLPWVYLQAGDFGRADEVVAWMGHRTMEGYNRTIFQNARASVSWMRGNLHEAAEDIDHLRSRGVSKRWAHSFYPLAAEVAADLARLDEVREVTDAYLAMTLHPTREAAKLGVLYPLVRAEVDAAVDTGSGEHVERAHDALALMRRILHESPPLVDGWTSVMTHTQNLTFAEAETTRLGSPDPKRWAEAANHADYAYYRLYARWRMAQALLQSGDRSSSGSAALREAYVDADRTGARLLCDRMEHTAREHNLLLG